MYPYKQNNLTYLIYNDDCFDNEGCDFKYCNKSFDWESVVTDTCVVFKNLYLMYITYVSYVTLALLKSQVLNKYHHQNISMSSYSSRGLIPENQEIVFAMYHRMRAKWKYWDGTSRVYWAPHAIVVHQKSQKVGGKNQ